MEQTLFDRSGRAQAYIAEDGEGSIYTWDGHAVAYIDGENVFGWRGRHLGWFADGTVYDRSGRRVGFIREESPVAPYAEAAKYAKYAKYARSARQAAYARPALGMGYSDIDLLDFVKQDAVGS